MEVEAQIISSEFQPDASPGEAPSDHNTSRIRADFEGLLELAEKLQQSYEERAGSHQKLFMTLQFFEFLLLFELVAGFLIVFLLVSLGLSFILLKAPLPSPPSPVTSNVSLIADVIFGGATYFYSKSLRYQYQELKRRMRADERDLSDVVELLREIEPVFAKKEKLSVLERVQIRIRLSRFGIGSSSRGDAESVAREQNGDSRAHKSRVDQEMMKPF